MEGNHNRIIGQAAGSVLKGMGLFRKGSSRLWIDDNGWFFIVVEFQHSKWAAGAYLNVAVHYLWSGNDFLSYDFGHRERELVAFSGDEERFYAEMVSLAECAAEKVTEYRRFRDIEYAKEQILRRNGFAAASVELYHRMMICGLAKDKAAKRYYSALVRDIRHSQLNYDIRYARELLEEIMPVIDEAEEFERFTRLKIAGQREFWRSKTSMKKMKTEAEF